MHTESQHSSEVKNQDAGPLSWGDMEMRQDSQMTEGISEGLLTQTSTTHAKRSKGVFCYMQTSTCVRETSIRNKTPKLKDTILRPSYWVAWLLLAITVGQHNAKHRLRKDSKQMSFRKVTETLLEENRSREPWWCEWIRGRTAAVTLGLCLR